MAWVPADARGFPILPPDGRDWSTWQMHDGYQNPSCPCRKGTKMQVIYEGPPGNLVLHEIEAPGRVPQAWDATCYGRFVISVDDVPLKAGIVRGYRFIREGALKQLAELARSAKSGDMSPDNKNGD